MCLSDGNPDPVPVDFALWPAALACGNNGVDAERDTVSLMRMLAQTCV